MIYKYPCIYIRGTVVLVIAKMKMEEVTGFNLTSQDE